MRRNHGESDMRHTGELRGLWWEWQWSGPVGWESFDVTASEKLEEVFTLGETLCRLSSQGTCQSFDLAAGREVDGPLHIRRVRMPLKHGGHSTSTCSTNFDVPDLEDEASTTTWADTDALGSCCTVGFSCAAAGGDSLLQGSVATSVMNSVWLESELDDALTPCNSLPSTGSMQLLSP